MKGKMPDYYEKWQEQNILDQKIAEIQDMVSKKLHTEEYR